MALDIRARGQRGEIYIYDEIGKGNIFEEEGVTAEGIRSQLAGVRNAQQLDIFINSMGGAIFEGLAIFEQLDRHPARKVVHVDGIAASIASVVAMVGDEIRIAENGFMMIHDGWTTTKGNAKTLRQVADTLEKVSGQMANAYASRTRQDIGTVQAMMEAETLMNAEEAVALGFADQISAAIDIAAKVRGMDLADVPGLPRELIEASNVVPLADYRGKTFVPRQEQPKLKAHPLLDLQLRALRDRGIDRGASPAKAAIA
jgi:ATP-dependent Clp protease protease subunit